ncbi:alpha/beta hydrolase (plasmid) [Sinorhizobium meliloti]|uniref:alpha/beta fold hydrolase n=1 Tax=Rhizobium meliloti TaxID=382 RepID=UPI002D780038|nr:alpha/beta hydrolase [Sinorhizobium meliloti]WRQ71561.1 alpha/beta hydrolase [Sinorhizobium meliloti]
MTTLVTIPGIMSDARTWSTVAEAVSLEEATVHVADISRDTTIEDMAARSLAETDGELIVLAHSMGGRVALEMGRQAPDRIRAMVLANTNADGVGEYEPAHREARIAEANADMVAYALGWVPKVISNASKHKPDLIAAILKMAEDCPPAVHERQHRALMARPDATAYLPDLCFPVLLLTGSEDHLASRASNEALAKLLKDAEVQVIEDAAHLLPFEQPEEVVATILRWVRRREIKLI